MKDMSWIEMMKKAQEIRLFTSLQIKRAQKGGITSAQELDLLSRIALSDAELTPLELTVLTGLSKSAVSRLIEHLERKELLQKKYNSNDKRSYTLLCTAKGTMELEKTYQYYLEPIYRLRKILGDEKFEALIKYIKEANDLMMKNGR